jgi:hypothetical protein
MKVSLTKNSNRTPTQSSAPPLSVDIYLGSSSSAAVDGTLGQYVKPLPLQQNIPPDLGNLLNKI